MRAACGAQRSARCCRGRFTIAARLTNGRIARTDPDAPPRPPGFDDVVDAVRQGYSVLEVGPGGGNTALLALNGEVFCAFELQRNGAFGPPQVTVREPRFVALMQQYGGFLQELNEPVSAADL